MSSQNLGLYCDHKKPKSKRLFSERSITHDLIPDELKSLPDVFINRIAKLFFVIGGNGGDGPAVLVIQV